jgi:hypothetical protein
MDGLKMNLREIGSGGVEWIHLAQDRDRWRAVVNAVMNLRVMAPRIQSVSMCSNLLIRQEPQVCITLPSTHSSQVLCCFMFAAATNPSWKIRQTASTLHCKPRAD